MCLIVMVSLTVALTATASDSDGSIASTSWLVAPVVSIIGGGRTVSDSDGESGETVALTASVSDSDGGIASTSWLVGGEVVASGTSATLSLPDGSTTVTFRATDEDGETTNTSVTITVVAPEDEQNTGSNEFAFFLEKESLELQPNPDGSIASAILIMNKSDLAITLSLYDPSGTRLESEREIQPGNSLLHAHQHYRPQKLSNADNRTLFWFLNSQNGTIEVRNNDWLFKPYQTGDFIIPDWVKSLQSSAQENAAPTVSITLAPEQITDRDGVAGEIVSVSATATDSDGSIASTSWLVGGELVANGTSANLSLPDGSTTVTFSATDDDGNSMSTSVTITVAAPEDEPASASNEVELVFDEELLEIKNSPDGLIASSILITNRSNQIITLSRYNPPRTRLEVEIEIPPGSSWLHSNYSDRPNKISNADNESIFWFFNSSNGTIEVDDNGQLYKPYQTGDFIIPEWVKSLQSAAQENAAPTVSITLAPEQMTDRDGIAGEIVSVSATVTDSDGSIASTSWLIGGEVVANGTSANLPLPDGSTTVTFRATDDDGDSTSTSVTITVEAPIETEEEFVSEYNGIAAPSFLSEEINTVSVFDLNKLKLKSCIELTLGGEPYSLNGYERYDMNFNLLSFDDLTFRLVDFRPFNLNGSRNQFGESPDCSGQFELSSNVYKDIIAVPGTTAAGNLKYDYYDLLIDLIDMDSLLFRLRDISIITGAE